VRQRVSVTKYQPKEFIYGLSKDAVSSSDYIASDDGGINKLERMWKEVAMT
jgi:hypothetical protein